MNHLIIFEGLVGIYFLNDIMLSQGRLCTKIPQRSLLVLIRSRNTNISNPLKQLPGLTSYYIRTLCMRAGIQSVVPSLPNSFSMATNEIGRYNYPLLPMLISGCNLVPRGSSPFVFTYRQVGVQMRHFVSFFVRVVSQGLLFRIVYLIFKLECCFVL